MAQPFFNSNYGSSLMRVDNSGLQQAGQAYGQMFANLGKTIGSTIEKFREGKEKKEQQQRSEDLFLRLYETNSDNPIFSALSIQSIEEAKAVAKDISKDPKLVADAMKFAQMQMDQQKRDQANELYDRTIAADERKIAKAQSENKFINKLFNPVPTGQLNRQGETEVENYSAFSAPNDPRIESFRTKTLADPNFQKTESLIGMADNRFLSQFQNSSPEVQARALQFIQTRKKDAPSISRVVNMEDGQGGFQQVGVDSTGNLIRSFGPSKPSGMFATPEQQAEARAKTLSVENANKFVNDQRNSALDSAKSIRPATRALTLLEKGDLETGGITEFKTNVTAMLDSLGIPIPEEIMDDVSNTQNFRAEVGKFLFENISNTKGSISEKEMDIFAKISPGLQMTPEANKTLLNYIIKKAERDKDKVKFIQKMRRDGVSVTEQRNKLEDFILDNDLSEILSPIAGEPSEQQTFRIGQKQVEGEVVGKKPDGSLIVKTKDGKIFVQPAQ